MKSNNSVKRKGAEKGSSCSIVMLISWTLILSWLAFLLYCWKSGQLHSPKYIGMLKNVSGKLSLRSSAIPIDYVPPATGAIPVESGDRTLEEVEKSDVHVIFSTDCSPYQDWQTLVAFHSATTVGQKGPVTRIASGCTDGKKMLLKELYLKLYPKYHVHFTPDFKKDAKSQRSYDFYNKPWGVKHWLDFANPKIPEDVAVALIDPDMIFVRPITTKIRGDPANLYNKHLPAESIHVKIDVGKPVAQMYGLGAPWANDFHKKFNRTKICGEGSPCLKPAQPYGEQHYSVGPPYIVVKSDMEKLTQTWTQFVPRVYEGYPYLLAEMYAYSMAAAHENLPHLQLENYMVSNTDAGGEGWPLIDKLDDVCVPPVNGIYFPGTPLPTLIHYCQNYRAGNIGFAKRQVPKNIFTCESPMLLEPPSDLIHANHRIKDGEKLPLSVRQIKRNAYTICVIHRSINAALVDYKTRMCGPTNTTSYEKTMNILSQG
mmetsp:Transcript_26662/g.25531  ORF Transcript_26662/g.25531 Transcript_26662/m.25531 type:complete len:485 (+) Transcript_26662:154-1608(+)